jgi:hypothetical protein
MDRLPRNPHAAGHRLAPPRADGRSPPQLGMARKRHAVVGSFGEEKALHGGGGFERREFPHSGADVIGACFPLATGFKSRTEEIADSFSALSVDSPALRVYRRIRTQPSPIRGCSPTSLPACDHYSERQRTYSRPCRISSPAEAPRPRQWPPRSRSFEAACWPNLRWRRGESNPRPRPHRQSVYKLRLPFRFARRPVDSRPTAGLVILWCRASGDDVPSAPSPFVDAADRATGRARSDAPRYGLGSESECAIVIRTCLFFPVD